MVGPETENARPPSFVLVLTVIADLVVDDQSQLLAESGSVNVTMFQRYAGRQW